MRGAGQREPEAVSEGPADQSAGLGVEPAPLIQGLGLFSFRLLRE